LNKINIIDNDNMTYNSNFEDEIALDGPDGFEDIPVSSQKVEFEGFKKAASKSERRRERRRRRNERTGKIAACVILLFIIIATILSIVFVEEIEHVLYGDSLQPVTETPTTSPTVAKPTMPISPSPTIVPKPTLSMLTPSPTRPGTAAPIAAPTDAPTTTHAPTAVMRDKYVFEPNADTYLHLNGPHKTKIHGREEMLSVERGNKESTLPGQEVTLPTIISLIQFDTTKEMGNSAALPKRSRWSEDANQVKVMLRIHHVPKGGSDGNTDELSVEDILPVNVEFYRLPNNHNMEIERLTGEGFQNAPKSVTEGILIAHQLVEATDKILEIDVTSALFLSEDVVGYGDEQVLFLLKVYWEEKSNASDLFKSRESDDGSPQLIFSNMISKET